MQNVKCPAPETPTGRPRRFSDRHKSLRRRRTKATTTTPFAPSRVRKGSQTARLRGNASRKTALSTRRPNVRGDERVGVFECVRAAERLSRHTGQCCRKRSSEQPKQGRLEPGVLPASTSLPKIAPRHHPHFSAPAGAAWNASLGCAVCIFWLSKSSICAWRTCVFANTVEWCSVAGEDVAVQARCHALSKLHSEQLIPSKQLWAMVLACA